MGPQEALLAGASIGLTVAAPIGPMAIIVIRRTLAGGFFAGVTTGAGASTVTLIYATCAVLGLDEVALHFQAYQNLIAMVIAAALAGFALRMLVHRATDVDRGSLKKSLVGNYASAVGLNLLNPVGFALLVSAVATAAGLSSKGPGQTSLLVAGAFVGSIAWWVCLVSATALLGLRFSPRSTRIIDVIASCVMFGLAGATIYRIL